MAAAPWFDVAVLDTEQWQLAVWGTTHRLIGLVLFIATVQWYHQLPLWAGSTGIVPVRDKMAQLKRDLSWAPLRFPNLYWISTSDVFLRIIVLVGSAASLSLFTGVGNSKAAAAVAWACYQSILFGFGWNWPWDDMGVETAFLSIFMPQLPVITTQWSAAVAPAPMTAFLMRWLAFRVMVGFGRTKFAESTLKDWDYLRGFSVRVPMPSYLGWLVFHGPKWMMVFGLVGMFVTEIIVPWGFLLPGVPRAVAGLCSILLMAAIHFTGNWGHFNILTAVVSMSALDVTSASVPLPSAGADWPELVAYGAAVGLLLPASLLMFAISNSWVNRVLWSIPGLQHLLPIRIMHFLGPYRIVHGYGVFPPHRCVLVRATGLVGVR